MPYTVSATAMTRRWKKQAALTGNTMGDYVLKCKDWKKNDNDGYYNFDIFKGGLGSTREAGEGHINCAQGYTEGMHVTLMPSKDLGVDVKTNYFFEFEEGRDNTITIVGVTPSGGKKATAKKSKAHPESSVSINDLPGAIKAPMKNFLVYLCRPSSK